MIVESINPVLLVHEFTPPSGRISQAITEEPFVGVVIRTTEHGARLDRSVLNRT